MIDEAAIVGIDDSFIAVPELDARDARADLAVANFLVESPVAPAIEPMLTSPGETWGWIADFETTSAVSTAFARLRSFTWFLRVCASTSPSRTIAIKLMRLKRPSKPSLGNRRRTL